MLVNPYLVMVVSSATQKELGPKLQKELIPSFEKMGRTKILKIAHISENKVEAAEDAVTFAPQLFRLQKSVILSEPSEPLFALPGGNLGNTDRSLAPTLPLQEWYKEADVLAVQRESLLLRQEKAREDEARARREVQSSDEGQQLGEQGVKSSQAEELR
jgi:hypothetical protein